MVAAMASACAHSDADFGQSAQPAAVVVRAPDFISLAKGLQPGVVNVSAMLSTGGAGSDWAA